MSAIGPRHWDVSNALCDMQIRIGPTHMQITVDAGKYESYSCQLRDYLDEHAVAPEISLREMVRRNGGDIVADEVAEEIRVRLKGTPDGTSMQQA